MIIFCIFSVSQQFLTKMYITHDKKENEKLNYKINQIQF